MKVQSGNLCTNVCRFKAAAQEGVLYLQCVQQDGSQAVTQ